MRKTSVFGLDDKLRLYPDDILAALIFRQRHGRALRLDIFEPPPEIARGLASVASPYPSGVPQRAVVMDRHRQCANRVRLGRRQREAGNNEFLRVVAFAL